MPDSDFDKSDEEWINKHMEENFPRFQFSFFPHGKDGEQLVVRGNDFLQFKEDIFTVKEKFGGNTTVAVSEQTTPAGNPTPANPKRLCQSCGSEMTHKTGTSANGAWGGFFCTNGPKGCGAKPVWDE
ncbi:hypothetical protein M0R04_14305 [Candidatus Dojkabacteria bacterium]|nr:hypothetical protein [Candidatus Dojkabacteria bacterium]